MALQATMVTNTVGVTMWLVFGAAVWARLRALLPAESMIPTCFAVGLVAFVTLLFVGFTAFDVLVYRQPDPGEAQVLYELAFGSPQQRRNHLLVPRPSIPCSVGAAPYSWSMIVRETVNGSYEVKVGAVVPFYSNQEKLEVRFVAVCDSVSPQSWHGEVRFLGRVLHKTESTAQWERAGRLAELAFADRFVEVFGD